MSRPLFLEGAHPLVHRAYANVRSVGRAAAVRFGRLEAIEALKRPKPKDNGNNEVGEWLANLGKQFGGDPVYDSNKKCFNVDFGPGSAISWNPDGTKLRVRGKQAAQTAAKFLLENGKNTIDISANANKKANANALQSVEGVGAAVRERREKAFAKSTELGGRVTALDGSDEALNTKADAFAEEARYLENPTELQNKLAAALKKDPEDPAEVAHLQKVQDKAKGLTKDECSKEADELKRLAESFRGIADETDASKKDVLRADLKKDLGEQKALQDKTVNTTFSEVINIKGISCETTREQCRKKLEKMEADWQSKLKKGELRFGQDSGQQDIQFGAPPTPSAPPAPSGLQVGPEPSAPPAPPGTFGTPISDEHNNATRFGEEAKTAGFGNDRGYSPSPTPTH